ncbi:MAG: hypothetical protein ACU826_00415 [Gammaproteobacteria bacterium]
MAESIQNFSGWLKGSLSQESLNKSLVVFSADGKAKCDLPLPKLNRTMTTFDFGDTSLHCGKHRFNHRFPIAGENFGMNNAAKARFHVLHGADSFSVIIFLFQPSTDV